jgi:hypothetical protein
MSQAVPERRLLLRYRAIGPGHPGLAVHRYLRDGARTIGWIAQWNEMIADPEQKIGRPRQLFVCSTVRDMPGIDKR